MKILILCTGNSCRSQMAHGLLKSFDKSLEVFSAGTNPASQVNPHAVQAMSEMGLNISHHRPEHVKTYLDQSWDYVITVCGDADENCPVFSGKVKKQVHIGFDDPADATGSVEEIQNEFRKIRDQILRDFYTFYNKNIRN